jgi:N-acylneuraminate cytidylyltransferase
VNNSVAIITARGGSKRIPKKNIKQFLGRPIISYTIEAALQAGCFDEVMVSTDDPEIAEVSKKYGAQIPFLRSKTTSNDFSTSAEVLEEVIREYEKINKQFEYFCCLYPTAPFITPEILRNGFRILKESNADSLLPVVRFSYPIQRALKIENGRLAMIWPENLAARSQDLMPAYHDAGQFYWCNTTRFRDQKKLFSEYAVPIVVPESHVQDIDNPEDWKIAEIKYTMLINDSK